MIAIVDYGVGNLRSVERALLHAGASPKITADKEDLQRANGLVLPGVGAFGAAVDALEGAGLARSVIDYAASGRPLLGVCLGFQLLFDWSDESGGRRGLGLLPGSVVRLVHSDGMKVPHMGWNQLRLQRTHPITEGLRDGAYVYFVHSYAARVEEATVIATCDYGGDIPAVCAQGNVVGTQFHPEKSSDDGLRIYANFVSACSAVAVTQ